MVGDHGAKPRNQHQCIDDAHHGGWRPQSRERPNSGRSRIPIRQPPSAAANQIQPCSDPDATPPKNAPMLQPKPMRAPQPISRPPRAAASSDFAGGHAVRANGFDAAAAAIAPRIMPRSVRLDVSERIDSASARFGPGHCQNAAPEKSNPASAASFAPHTVKPNVTLQGWWPARNTPIEMTPMAMAPITISGRGL